MSIYIALGDDALGPYTPAEIDQLLKCGCLFPDDYAARDGDTAWVPLSNLYPIEAALERVPDVPFTPATRWRWKRPLIVTILTALIVFAFGLPLLIRRTKDQDGRTVPPIPQPMMRATAPEIRELSLADSPSPPPAAEHGGRLRGTILPSASDDSPDELAALLVRAYSLKDIEPYLSQKKLAAQAELARLAPQAEAAEAERNARVAAERSALQAFLDTSPSDARYPSLRFAHQQAKGAVKTVEDDCLYYRSLRGAVTSGEYYMQDLPAPLATAETNARGEFTLELPSGGPFAVFVCARHEKAAGVHARYWALKVSFTDAGEKTLSLSDDNATSVASAETLIQTAD